MAVLDDDLKLKLGCLLRRLGLQRAPWQVLACMGAGLALLAGFGHLMVVDEFGPLEFNGGQGYTEGMAVMDEGLPANALLVLRPALLDAARQRWGDFETLGVDSPIDPFLEKIAR